MSSRSLNVALPVAIYHPGNPAEYLARSLARAGHTPQVLSHEQFIASLGSPAFDFYFIIDSGGAFDLGDPRISARSLGSVAFWFIDFRHNKNRAERKPTDFENARILHERGGWIFQAQYEDYLACRQAGLVHTSWLPLAADGDTWSHQPVSGKQFDVGFAGHIFDQARLDALRMIGAAGLRLNYPGHGKAWKEDAAALLRSSRLGFNISSFFGTSVSFDVNMRFFETLSCGVPLVTNWVPSLERLTGGPLPFIRTYRNIFEIVPVLHECLSDQVFLQTGAEAAAWVRNNASYDRRWAQAQTILKEAGRLPGSE